MTQPSPTVGEFSDRVLLVTGGGSGIGAAVAAAFTAAGGRVAVVDFRLDAARQVAAELPGAQAFEADVSDEDAVVAAVAAADRHFGRIDCVVNAAGHAVTGPIETWSYAEWNRMLAVHVGGTFLICRETVPILRRGGGGTIVNIASIAAYVTQPNNAPYGAAKGAIVVFSRQLAIELAPQIRVNVVAPGRIQTPINADLILARGDGDYAKGLEVTRGLNPLNHLAQPAELAESVLFLLGPRSVFVTAASLVVDGGETAL